MNNAIVSIPEMTNEPVYNYEPGSREREEIVAELDRQYSRQIDIPLVIGGQEIRTKKSRTCVCPHEHGHVLARYSLAGPKEVKQAIKAALKAHKQWESTPWEDRASIFLRAAELLSTKYRSTLNAATMLCQSKTVFQAEIDSACELVDFFRFNVWYMQQIYADQPPKHAKGTWNRLEYRPLEGFIFAVTPFNFTSIAGNLPSAPALMGNTVVWKPASTAVYSGYFLTKLFEEAGVPPGVINFVPGSGPDISGPVLNNIHLAGIHFTGSTDVFSHLWQEVGRNLRSYCAYPRIVGETGGKDFIVVHPSADVDEAMTAAIRGAYDYQGQKCSAASRMYVPESHWGELKPRMEALLASITVGDVREFKHFMNAVIDETAFDKIVGYIDQARASDQAEVIFGGEADKSEGYFIQPTVIQALDPEFVTMREEIFGPVLTVFVYPDKDYEKVLRLCDKNSWYALTGAVFANDRSAIRQASEILRYAAGNFYINDKPTGAVVGQQPFGGARASGTNDKAGSYLNLIRWISPRTIKETFCPPRNYRYLFMDE